MSSFKFFFLGVRKNSARLPVLLLISLDFTADKGTGVDGFVGNSGYAGIG